MRSVQFQTMADKQGQLVDINMLYLQLEYSQASIDTVKSAAKQFAGFIQSFFDDQFVSLCEVECFRNVIRTDCAGIPEAIDKSDISPKYIVEANVRTDSINNASQLRKYRHNLQTNVLAYPFTEAAYNYISYYKENIRPFIKDNEKLKNAIDRSLKEEQAVSLNYYIILDSDATFYSMPENIGSAQLHGSVNFRIALGCLGDAVDICAELFAEELRKLCVTLGTSCGRVGLAPLPYTCLTNPYMAYFGSIKAPTTADIIETLPEDCFVKNWLKVYYLCGCDWVNILSPIARKHLLNAKSKQGSTHLIEVTELENNGLQVKASKSLSEFGMEDLLYMKLFLYPALYPGGKKGSLNNGPIKSFPRMCWEKVPIFPNEYLIDGDDICYFSESIRCQFSD